MTLAPHDQPVIAYWKVLRWTEDFWNQFCEQQRLIFEGVVPDTGLVKTAKEWSISVVELQHLRLECGVMLDEAERRSKLADRMLALSEITTEIAMDKFQDELQVSALELSKTAAMARGFSDAALNLKNGATQPTNQVINIREVRQIIQLNASMPETFEPLKLKAANAVEVEE